MVTFCINSGLERTALLLQLLQATTYTGIRWVAYLSLGGLLQVRQGKGHQYRRASTDLRSQWYTQRSAPGFLREIGVPSLSSHLSPANGRQPTLHPSGRLPKIKVSGVTWFFKYIRPLALVA